MRFGFALILALACAIVAGCKSGGARPPPQTTDDHKADSQSAAHPDAGSADTAHHDEAPALATCMPTGAACFDRAQAAVEKEPARGEHDLEACLGCEDAPVASYRLLATLREDRNAKSEAREALMLGVRRHPSSALLWLGLGRLELGLGHSKEGLEAMAAAHRLMPADEDIEREYKMALGRYGSSEDRIGEELDRLILEAAGRAEIDDFKGAIETLQMALIKASKVPHFVALVHQRMGLVHLRHGDRKLAADELSKALAFEREASELRAEALISYSEALLGANRADEAIKAAQEAIAIEPKNPLAHANLGIARAMKNDKDGAIKALAAACDFGLSRHLTLAEFMAIGAPIEKIKNHPDFVPLVKKAWPKSDYPPPDPKKK